MFFRSKVIANDVLRWLSIIDPAMRLYWCIVEVYSWFIKQEIWEFENTSIFFTVNLAHGIIADFLNKSAVTIQRKPPWRSFYKIGNTVVIFIKFNEELYGDKDIAWFVCQKNHNDFHLYKLSMTNLRRAGQITLTDREKSFTDYLLDLPSLLPDPFSLLGQLIET